MTEQYLFHYALLLLACVVFTLASAQNSTAPSRNKAQGPVGWQANPNRRGTLNIIESCVFTILACTWSIQHLNVPAPSESGCTKMRRKIKWTILTILFPELLTAHAIAELYMAALATREYERRLRSGSMDNISIRLPWWFRAFRRDEPINFDKEGSPQCDSQKQVKNNRTCVMEWTLTHSYYANMGGFHLCEERNLLLTDEKSPQSNRDPPKNEPQNAFTGMLLPLTANLIADHWEHIRPFNISEVEIKEKSKADFFTKAVASSQILYLVISVIVRAVRHLAFTQLELVTLAFAVCGVLTYIFRWYKPQGVETATKIWLSTKAEEVQGLREKQFDRLWNMLRTHERDVRPETLSRIPNDYLPRGRPQRIHPLLYLLTVITVSFGGIHLIAWNFEFPTLAEKFAWRSVALASVCLPPIALLVIPVSQLVHVRLVGNDTRGFIRACMYAIKEYSWEVSNNGPLKDSYKRLEKVYNGVDDNSPEYYGDIFNWNDPEITKEGLRDLVSSRQKDFRKEFDGIFPRDFHKNISELVEVIDGKQKFRYLEEADRTDRFPPKRLQWPSVVLSLIGITYCMARLCILALAFSTLRAMPNSVYESVWTNVLPNVQ
jgi:hypothetical protein